MRQSEAKGVIKHLDCVKAFAEGKIIQTKLKDDWFDESNPCWYPEHEYRIKPGKRVVPYENDKEFYEAWCVKAPFIKRKGSKANSQYFPVSIYNKSITLGSINVTWEILLNDYEYADGTPCGKEVME